MKNEVKFDKLKLSDQTKELLSSIGIDSVEAFDIYTIDNYRAVLSNSADEQVLDEVVKTLRKIHAPSKLENLSLSEETVKFLVENGVENTENLLETDRTTLYHILKEDEFLLNDVNKLFEFYHLEQLSSKDFDKQQEIISHQQKVSEISIEDRIQKLSNEKEYKGYGSRNYKHLKIRIASPEEIRMWSYGEVKNHETINYRTSKPEEGGLFCEKIFGPTKDFQCACGKKQNGNKGQICPRCGIEITESVVRRERMGHIELEAPIVHTWYLKNSPSRLAILLGIKAKLLEDVINYSAYIVTDAGDISILKRKQILSEQEYSMLSEKYGQKFEALTGAEAVRKLLEGLDLEKESKILRRKYKVSTKQKRDKLIKRLEIIEAFKNSDNKPEWIVMDVIPVISPDLRPMVPLDGGRFATTDLNDLYRKILNRNNRFKRQKEQNCPQLLLKNERRLIQEAVDSLFDNSKRAKRVTTTNDRPLKSLSDLLRGKQGRFRQNLLGKRVDYSGRSVIIIGPDLKMYQAGIPREMAIILFKPFVLRELQKRLNLAEGDKRKAVIEYDERNPEVWEALEHVVEEHPVLLNRAPTLHRLGIQAFEPKLIDGKAIRIHPLVTTAFNADFDGDQMAVHLPLSPEAQAEARLLMLASNNILNPKDGKPVVTPTQDMVLGNYYLTLEEHYDVNKPETEINKNEGMFFSNVEEINYAYENGLIDYHTRIVVRPQALNHFFTEEQKNKYLVTTYGKVIFNQIFPESFPYLNEPTDDNLKNGTPNKYFIERGTNPKDYFEKNKEITKPFNKKFLGKIIEAIFKNYKITETSILLDKLKDTGFKYSTIAGVTVSFSDINIYTKKNEVIEKTNKKVAEITKFFEEGMTTDSERSKLVIKEWELATKAISEGLLKELKETGNNPLNLISDSGARGSDQNFAQLAGIRGILNNPKGEKIEVPVKASFREGLTVSEFFISTHAARKGSTDTALKTAESGYLTRRLVDVSQDVIVSSEDCGTERGFVMKNITNRDGKETVALKDRIIGRFAARTIENDGEVIVRRNELITEDIAKKVAELGLNEVVIRSNLTCDEKNGVCARCYGRNLATNEKVEVGEAVGVIAAQSIGEPGTQLTMRTFHTGGVASASDITQGLPRIQELFEARKPKGKAVISEYSGRVKAIDQTKANQAIIIERLDNKEEKTYQLDLSADICVKKGQFVEPGQPLTLGSISPKELLRVAGVLAVENYILSEVQSVYRSQNVEISDKHIEIIIRQMLKRVVVVTEGDTQLLPGVEISVNDFNKSNKEALLQGKRPAVAKAILLGITRASLRGESFLSAASFQETTRILNDAAIRGKVDELRGLKENVIIGSLIPTGTGILRDEFFSYQGSIENDFEDKKEY